MTQVLGLKAKKARPFTAAWPFFLFLEPYTAPNASSIFALAVALRVIDRLQIAVCQCAAEEFDFVD